MLIGPGFIKDRVNLPGGQWTSWRWDREYRRASKTRTNREYTLRWNRKYRARKRNDR